MIARGDRTAVHSEAELAPDPLTRPATADESAVVGHPLPKGEGWRRKRGRGHLTYCERAATDETEFRFSSFQFPISNEE